MSLTRQDVLSVHQSGDQAQALALYTRYLSVNPKDAQMWSNYGVLLRAMGKHELALMAQERSHAIQPLGVSNTNNLANILSDLGQYGRSIDLRKRLLEHEEHTPEHKVMIGRCMRGQGRYDDAITWLRSHAPDHPNDPDFDMQLAFALLGKGEYLDGFQHYQSRWLTDEISPRAMSIPEWQGEDISGKKLCVLPEQGFGDTVLFARFLPAARASGAHISMLAEKPVLRLLQEVDGVDALWSKEPEEAAPDYWVNLVDLAINHFSETSVVPAPPQLHVPEDSVARAKAITEPFAERFKIGVNWNGSVTYKNNAFRSFDARHYLELEDLPQVQMFSLYKGPGLEEFQQDGSSAFILDASANDRDFADCAGLMAEMDLIITSDTATAHIAGALGCPVWVLLHWDPFWVYGHEGDSTEWYPNMKLYRQPKPGDWDGVFAQVRADLDAMSNG